ncbi:hypothetical protein [Amycolatopsis japonica]
MQVWEEELMAKITGGTIEWLHEQVADAEIVINRKRLGERRREEYRDYRVRLLAEIAARG